MIGSPTTYPACGLSGSLQVGKKQQSTSSDKVRNAQKMDTAVDRKLPDDQDFASIFSRVIGRELSHSSINDLYLRCSMNFVNDPF